MFVDVVAGSGVALSIVKASDLPSCIVESEDTLSTWPLPVSHLPEAQPTAAAG